LAFSAAAVGAGQDDKGPRFSPSLGAKYRAG